MKNPIPVEVVAEIDNKWVENWVRTHGAVPLPNREHFIVGEDGKTYRVVVEGTKP